MLVNRQTFPRLHRIWLFVVLVAVSGATAWYVAEWRGMDRLPGGGSRVGLTLGVISALLCLFEFALVIRKTSWFRTRRRIFGIPTGNARTWMAAHIWLGLLVLPLAVMHSGFQLGGGLTSWLGITFLIVIGSGIAGLLLQNILPRLMTTQVPEETIYSQIELVGQQFAADALRLARLYGGSGPEGFWSDWERQLAGVTQSAAAAEVEPEVARVGAPRRVGTMVSRSPRVAESIPRAADSPDLRRAVHDDVLQFLSTGLATGDSFSTAQRINWYFDDLRRRVRPEVATAVDQIEQLCLRRRQHQTQRRIHFWLHSWLSVHLPLSVGLMILLLAHIVIALIYN
ncbi:MAG: hypothetical protein ACKOBW_02020 [Planctomycetota bacterium]